MKLYRAFGHLYWAIRHGDWDYGCEFYDEKPMAGIFLDYYDGYWLSFHLGPFWANAHYL